MKRLPRSKSAPPTGFQLAVLSLLSAIVAVALLRDYSSTHVSSVSYLDNGGKTALADLLNGGRGWEDAGQNGALPDASSSFTLYLGHAGDCSIGIIAQGVPTISLDVALTTCHTNPNCTFFSFDLNHHVADYCSGRKATSSDGSIQAPQSKDNVASVQYVSGDKLGCEQYTVELAFRDAKKLSLPSCRSGLQRCGVVHKATGDCLSKMINFDIDGTILTADKKSAFCVSDGNVLQLTPAKHAARDSSCLWVGDESARFNFKNEQSHEKLLFEHLILNESGSLVIEAMCICHNVDYGLVVGPWCESEDCRWKLDNDRCMHRNQQTGACISDLLDSKNNRKNLNCLCQSGSDTLMAKSGRACSDKQCQWERRRGGLRNIANQNFLKLDYSLAHQHALTVSPALCLCSNAKKGLRLDSTCNEDECKWNIPGVPAVAELQHHPNFSLKANEHYKCVLQLHSPLATRSFEDALQLCLEEPMCTYVAYRPSDGNTEICNGHYAGQDALFRDANEWYSGFRKRCEDVTESIVMQQLIAGHPTVCNEEASCSCPEGTHMIVGCSDERKAVCDSCHGGYCLEIKPGQRARITLSSKTLASLKLDKHFKAFNPSLFRSNGEIHAIFTVSNHTFCGRQKLQGDVFYSFPLRCKMQYSSAGLSVIENSCVRVHVTVDDFNLGSKIEHPVFRGFQDVQAFQYKNKIYLLGTLNLFQQTTNVSGFRTVAEGLAALDSRLIDTTLAVILSRSNKMQQIQEKNWMALVKDNELYFVTQVLPLQVLRFDITTRELIPVQTSGNAKFVNQPMLGGWPLRGGTPFIDLGWGWLSLVHRKVDYPFGPVYTHHMITITFSEEAGFKLSNISPGFRLPQFDAKVSQDIQSASGLLEDGDDLVIGFGIADCSAGFAVLPGLLGQLRNNARTLPVIFSDLLRGQIDKPRTVIRWEGPVADTLSFASVARQLGAALLRQGIDMDFHDTSKDPIPALLQNPAYKDVADRVLRLNADLLRPPEILVRMTWPPNLHPAAGSELVVYLPWEFQGIPKRWVHAINNHVSEVWVPSTYNKDIFEAAGVMSSKIVIVPHGVKPASEICLETDRVKPQPPKIRTEKNFKFMFFGAALWRKGVDVLLRAYTSAFTAADDVTLILAVSYGESPVMEMLQAAIDAVDEHGPEIRVIHARLTADEVKQLYASADVYIQPARGEGFGMTIAEAMMCGIPVITPDFGGHTDFATNETALWVKSKAVPCDKLPCVKKTEKEPPSVFGWETESELKWMEPDVSDLGKKMMYAYKNRKAMLKKAEKAKAWLDTYFTWDAAAKIVAQRVGILTNNGHDDV